MALGQGHGLAPEHHRAICNTFVLRLGSYRERQMKYRRWPRVRLPQGQRKSPFPIPVPHTLLPVHPVNSMLCMPGSSSW
jgi:hypothetical protein